MTTASLDAYHEIVAKGLLARRQFVVYDYIRSHGPVSINTMLSNLAKPGDNTGAWTGRVCELRDMGVIRRYNEGMGPKGHPVTLWEIVPGAIPKKLAKRETKEAKIKRLEIHIMRLERAMELERANANPFASQTFIT